MSTKRYNELRHVLLAHYDAAEAKAIALLVLEEGFGVTLTDICVGKDRHFSEEESRRWQNILSALAAGQPVQYVLGNAEFCGRRFCVTPATLIPRPETATAVRCALSAAATFCEKNGAAAPLRLLDVGTGSGCIAITLYHLLREGGLAATVDAWDISSAALAVARDNAQRLGAVVDFVENDVFAPVVTHPYEVIVSNPPYVMDSERATMAPHVLDYEPSLALFVPDANPLRYYKALCALASTALTPGGRLVVEINSALGPQTVELFRSAGFTDVELVADDYGRDRVVSGMVPTR